MQTYKTNLEETKQHYLDWWQHRGVVVNMWEHFQNGVTPHAIVKKPDEPKDLNKKWFDAAYRTDYLDWYVANSCLEADMLPVANTQLGPGSLAAILGGRLEGGKDTIWIHPDPEFKEDIAFDANHPVFLLHKDLLQRCKQRAKGRYYVGMPDLMEGLDVIAALKGTDKVLLDTALHPERLERQVQKINEIYFQVFDELYDIIREGDEMAFCYFSLWAPGKMAKLQSDISTMISQADYRRFVQPYIRQQAQRLDYSLYHLDGVGAMHHLNALLEIDELDAIQWTPGAGEPQGGSPKWYDLYRRILTHNKSVMACWVKVDELAALLDNIGTEGVHLEMDFSSIDEVHQALEIVERKRQAAPLAAYIPRRTDENKEVHRIIHKTQQEHKPLQLIDQPDTDGQSTAAELSTNQSQTVDLSLYEAILLGNSNLAKEKALFEAETRKRHAGDIIQEDMIAAMEEIGSRFSRREAFVPNLLLSGQAMKAALAALDPFMAGEKTMQKGVCVLGTVQGDLHDIGKNLVASMLEGCGYKVVNIGIDVSKERFVEAVRNNHADLLSMTALLTTTMTYFKEVIDALKEAHLRDSVKVMVGGAPVTRQYAESIGADGFGEDANAAVKEADRLLGND